MDIMMTLFNREQVLEAYVLEREEAAAEKAAKASAVKMKARGMDVVEIADVVGYSIEVVKKWLGMLPV